MTGRMGNYIAILEDDAERIEHMKQILVSNFSDFSACFFSDAPSMIDWLRDHLRDVSLISLDHDLIPDDVSLPDPGTGRDVADYLSSESAQCPVIIHSTNYYGREGMKYALRDAGWTVEIVSPEPDIMWIEKRWAAEVLKQLKDGRELNHLDPGSSPG